MIEIINNPYDEKEKEGMATPTAEEINGALPNKLAKDATPEQKQAYYKELEAVGKKILEGFFAEVHHDKLTARRPFSGLKTTDYYSDAKKMKEALWEKRKDKTLYHPRSAEIGHAIQLVSQQIWLDKASIPNVEKLTWEEKVDAIRIKNDDLKKTLLVEWLQLPDDKRIIGNFKRRVTKAKKTKPVKTTTTKEKAPKKVEPKATVAKAKPVIGKKEIDALIKQAETAEKELTKAKADLDKAMDKVKQAHGKIKEELMVTKRLMDREG